MSDIVERLRRINARDWDGDISFAPTEAADEIERLRAENARLRDALTISVWTEEERDGMSEAFRMASDRHGYYETLFTVAAWILRYRVRKALEAKE